MSVEKWEFSQLSCSGKRERELMSVCYRYYLLNEKNLSSIIKIRTSSNLMKIYESRLELAVKCRPRKNNFLPGNTNWRQKMSAHQRSIFVLNLHVYKHIRLYSKSSLTLKEWRFNLSFPWVSVLFLNSWMVSSYIVRYDTNPPAIQKRHWHSKEAQIEPPLFECEREWAFSIQAIVF
jgi:hypothetical protein